MVAFPVSGLMGLLTWWLDGRVRLSAEMYDRFERLATCGIGPLLDGTPQGPDPDDYPV
ncbi:hypothetical protein [Pseudonocardia hydrocarbonoxydans]|uniref:Uncharacterized protein n=1 Tax=Pseudonocardia hydrocarbonoxydans TaxID=76726 RepID=A0A4Y3WIF3_9PSEU|nr:hypothetical protein [Pseudonocardia hydrocarbonoxydans]GEC18643.1 hypothetical protein PHY01_09260 [Pseudonocardia hydrocarbonoxydans]